MFKRASIALLTLAAFACGAGERPKPAAEEGGISVYFSPNGGAADAVAY